MMINRISRRTIRKSSKIICIHEVNFATLATYNPYSANASSRENGRIKESNSRRPEISIASVQTLIFEWLEIILLGQDTGSWIDTERCNCLLKSADGLLPAGR